MPRLWCSLKLLMPLLSFTLLRNMMAAGFYRLSAEVISSFSKCIRKVVLSNKIKKHSHNKTQLQICLEIKKNSPERNIHALTVHWLKLEYDWLQGYWPYWPAEDSVIPYGGGQWGHLRVGLYTVCVVSWIKTASFLMMLSWIDNFPTALLKKIRNFTGETSPTLSFFSHTV